MLYLAPLLKDRNLIHIVRIQEPDGLRYDMHICPLNLHRGQTIEDDNRCQRDLKLASLLVELKYIMGKQGQILSGITFTR